MQRPTGVGIGGDDQPLVTCGRRVSIGSLSGIRDCPFSISPGLNVLTFFLPAPPGGLLGVGSPLV